MNAQSLACSASSSRTAPVPPRAPRAQHPSSAARAANAISATGRPGPGREVPVRGPSCSPAIPRARAPAAAVRARPRGSLRASASSRRTSSRPWRGALLHDAPAASRPPHTTSARAARCRARRRPAGLRRRHRARRPRCSRVIVRATKSAACVARRAPAPRRVVVGAAGVVPRVVLVDGVVVVVAVGARRRVAAVAPDERHRAAVDRHEHAPPTRSASGRRCSSAPEAEAVGQLDAHRAARRRPRSARSSHGA